MDFLSLRPGLLLVLLPFGTEWCFVWERNMDPQRSLHPGITLKPACPFKYQLATPETYEPSGFIQEYFFVSAGHGVNLVFPPLSSLEQAWHSI